MKTATTTASAWPISPPKPRNSLAKKSHKTLSIKHPNTALLSIGLVVKCNKNGSPGSGSDGSFKDVLSGMVDERVEELLNKEENRGMLEGLEDATLRVENAKRELAEIERQEIDAKIMKDYINRLEARASMIAECQKEIAEARAMVEKAEQSLTERSADASVEYQSKVIINQDAERLESLKAAFIAAVVGTLAELPITLTRTTTAPQLILPLAITFVTCSLFGITFRYAIRRDLNNFQLKSGTSAAFGLVKGLGAVGAGMPMDDASRILSTAFDGAVCVSENLLIFLFAGVALDFCMNSRIVSPFPMDQSSNDITNS